MLNRSITLVGLSGAISSIPCVALGLGPVQQQSAIDEPLAAIVKVLDSADLNIDSLSVVSASSAEFELRGLSAQNFVEDLKTELVRTEGKAPFVRLSSTEPITAAIINFALKAEWEEGSLIQQYTLLMKDPPAEGGENFIDDDALSALSDLEMLESEAMSTQQEDNNNTVWNLDNDVERRTEWKVSDERSLQEIAVHIRPSNTVSIEQMVIALIKKNTELVQQRQSLALDAGDMVKLPSNEEIAAVNKLSAGQELAELQERLQGDQSTEAHFPSDAANEPTSTTSNNLSAQQSGVLSLGSVEISHPGAKPMQGTADRTKSTDLARRLENVIARLGDANQVINSHIREINDLNVLVEDLKHTIDLKNAELAALQARVLGAMQAQDSVEHSAQVASSRGAGTLPTQAMNDELSTPENVEQAGLSSAAEPTTNHSVFAGFLAIMAALFSTITFARLRARRAQLSESNVADAEKVEAEARQSTKPTSQSDASLCFDDDELQKHFDEQKGSVIGEAEVLTAFGRHEQAIGHLKRALEKDPQSSELMGALRETFILSGNYEQAAELFPDLESANDNALIDSDYVKQTLVIDDLEEPFDESKPPVWQPPAAASDKSATADNTVQSGADTEVAHNQNDGVPVGESEQEKQQTSADKAAARKRSRRARKAKVAKRRKSNKVVSSKETDKPAKRIAKTAHSKVPENARGSSTTAVESRTNAAGSAASTSEHKNTAKAKPALAAPELTQDNQSSEQLKDNTDMFTDDSDFFTEVEATPFELVQAYIELDDREGARRMLEDILGDGKPNERARAKELLEEIA